jgi:hypothetical protein
MRFAELTCITAIALFNLRAIPVQLAAQDKQDHHHMHHHYKRIDIGTFGGPNTNFVTQGVGAQVLNKRRESCWRRGLRLQPCGRGCSNSQESSGYARIDNGRSANSPPFSQTRLRPRHFGTQSGT